MYSRLLVSCGSGCRHPHPRPGRAIESHCTQRSEFRLARHAFGDHQQADAVRNRTDTLEEGLIARIGIQVPDKARVNLDVAQPEVMQAADLAELPAEVFDTRPALKTAQQFAQRAECVHVLQRTGFGNLHPEAACRFSVPTQQGAKLLLEIDLCNGTPRQIDRQARQARLPFGYRRGGLRRR